MDPPSLPSASPLLPPKRPIRTISLHSHIDPDSPPVTVALARSNQTYSLVSIPASALESASLWTALSIFIVKEPFPGYSVNGNEMIWVKNYSENVGYLEQLIEAGWLIQSGRSAKQGFVQVPMCEIRVLEEETVQYCNGCDIFESIAGARFSRCATCKRRYYCSKQCQSDHWPSHRLDCKDLKALRYAEVQNRENAYRIKELRGMGFETVTTNA